MKKDNKIDVAAEAFKTDLMVEVGSADVFDQEGGFDDDDIIGFEPVNDDIEKPKSKVEPKPEPTTNRSLNPSNGVYDMKNSIAQFETELEKFDKDSISIVVENDLVKITNTTVYPQQSDVTIKQYDAYRMYQLIKKFWINLMEDSKTFHLSEREKTSVFLLLLSQNRKKAESKFGIDSLKYNTLEITESSSYADKRLFDYAHQAITGIMKNYNPADSIKFVEYVDLETTKDKQDTKKDTAKTKDELLDFSCSSENDGKGKCDILFQYLIQWSVKNGTDEFDIKKHLLSLINLTSINVNRIAKCHIYDVLMDENLLPDFLTWKNKKYNKAQDSSTTSQKTSTTPVKKSTPTKNLKPVQPEPIDPTLNIFVCSSRYVGVKCFDEDGDEEIKLPESYCKSIKRTKSKDQYLDPLVHQCDCGCYFVNLAKFDLLHTDGAKIRKNLQLSKMIEEDLISTPVETMSSAIEVVDLHKKTTAELLGNPLRINPNKPVVVKSTSAPKSMAELIALEPLIPTWENKKKSY